MCFFRTSKHKRSDTTITVYKVMRSFNDGTVSSFFHSNGNFFGIGDTITAAKDISIAEIDEESILGEEVVHAFSTKNKAKDNASFLRLFCGANVIVVECKISAGVPYWVCQQKSEIVAKEMKVTGFYY